MGDWTMLLMLAGLLVVMYFVMIRPQKKQEKAQNDMRNNLAVGDEDRKSTRLNSSHLN